MKPKPQATKEKKLDFIKMKNFLPQGTPSRVNNPQNNRKYLQSYLIRDLYPEYIKKSYNSIINIQKPNYKVANNLSRHFSKEDI